MNWKGILFFAGYGVFFLLCLIVVAHLSRRKRLRHPLPDNLKLLRMPGENLWRRISESDENSIPEFLLAALVPLLVLTGGASIALTCFKDSLPIAMGIGITVFLAALYLCVRWLQKRWERRSDDYLGFFGERYVAEYLEPLKYEGWFIFHDVPFEGATGKFNIDHIAVGTSGLWVVETKTRRKPKSGDARKDAKVESDGTNISWPTGTDSRSIQQAVNNARSLEKWIQTVTGMTITAKSVVALPGWMVYERKLGPARVTNPMLLVPMLLGDGKRVFNPDQVDLIRRQLEQRCRDVEY